MNKLLKHKLGLLLFIGLIFCSRLSNAYPLETTDHINELAKQFIENTINVSPADKLDVIVSNASKNIQVAQCGVPITVSFPVDAPQESASTVEMSCAGPQTWHIYVPLSIRIMTKVVVSKQPIQAKETITEDMLDYAEYDKNHLYGGYLKDISEAVGQESVSSITSGTIMTRHGLQKPILIHRGQNVSIVAKKGFIMVKADGVAKSDGGINDMIKVYNPASKRLIDGTVTSSSSIEVL